MVLLTVKTDLSTAAMVLSSSPCLEKMTRSQADEGADAVFHEGIHALPLLQLGKKAQLTKRKLQVEVQRNSLG